MSDLSEREADNVMHSAFYEASARRDRAQFDEAVEAFRMDVRKHLNILEGLRGFAYRRAGGMYAPPWQVHAITGVQHEIDAAHFINDLEEIVVDEALASHFADWVVGE